MSDSQICRVCMMIRRQKLAASPPQITTTASVFRGICTEAEGGLVGCVQLFCRSVGGT